jgi:hypothetical protein
MTQQAISEMWGVSRPAVTQMIRRAREDLKRDDKDDKRQAQVEEIADAKRIVWEIISGRSFRYTVTGALMRNPDGSPAIDESVTLSAITVLNRLLEREDKLQGLAPSSRKVEYSEELVGIWISELEQRVEEASKHVLPTEPEPRMLAIQGQVEPD